MSPKVNVPKISYGINYFFEGNQSGQGPKMIITCIDEVLPDLPNEPDDEDWYNEIERHGLNIIYNIDEILDFHFDWIEEASN